MPYHFDSRCPCSDKLNIVQTDRCKSHQYSLTIIRSFAKPTEEYSLG